MKKIIYSGLAVLSAIFVTSCDNDQVGNDNKANDLISYARTINTDDFADTENDLFVNVVYNNDVYSGGGNVVFHGHEAGIKPEVNIDGLSIDFSQAENFDIVNSINPSYESILNVGNKNVSFEVDGQSVSGTVYNPTPVSVGIDDVTVSIDLSEGISFNWETDRNAIDKVSVVLINRGDRDNGGAIPENSQISLLVDDLGGVAISSQDLINAGFNVDDTVYIYFGRANAEVIGKTAVFMTNMNVFIGKVVQ